MHKKRITIIICWVFAMLSVSLSSSMNAAEEPVPNVSSLRIGYYKHWTRPDYSYCDFLKSKGYNIQVADYEKEGYLENFDVVIVEQDGFNDYVENDEIYIHDWIRRGGILLFMHQDYKRWAPTFLPSELGFVQLIHRHVSTYSYLKIYMMPWVDSAHTDLFTYPNKIEPPELVYWSLILGGQKHPTTAFSCYLPDSPVWNVLGEYKDPAVKDGALLLEAKYGKGLVFLNQLLFPDKLAGNSPKIFPFWEKYTENLLAHFERFKAGRKTELIPHGRTLPVKKNYNLALHVHALDWYGADSSIGTTSAALREYHYDIGVLAVKDTRLYNGKLQLERYSDEHLLMLPGQEYHPFNFGGSYAYDSSNYHTITVGVPEKDITFRFTSTIYSDAQGDAYLDKMLEFVHSKGGLAGATHVSSDVWRRHAYDMVDLAPLRPLQGTDIEKHWLAGKRITLVNSIDMWGIYRLIKYPAGNFIYVEGTPTVASIVKALHEGHVITGTFFQAADITWGSKLPGDTLTTAEEQAADLQISAELYENSLAGNLLEIRVFAGTKLIRQIPCEKKKCSASIRFTAEELKGAPYVRVEVLGLQESVILASNPFYLTEN